MSIESELAELIEETRVSNRQMKRLTHLIAVLTVYLAAFTLATYLMAAVESLPLAEVSIVVAFIVMLGLVIFIHFVGE